MPLIGVAAQNFDPNGARLVRVSPESIHEMTSGERRTAFQATLDGGILVFDTGYAAADRQFTLTASAYSGVVRDLFARLVRGYDRITVSLPDGVFEAVPQAYAMKDNRPALTVRLVRAR